MQNFTATQEEIDPLFPDVFTNLTCTFATVEWLSRLLASNVANDNESMAMMSEPPGVLLLLEVQLLVIILIRFF